MHRNLVRALCIKSWFTAEDITAAVTKIKDEQCGALADETFDVVLNLIHMLVKAAGRKGMRTFISDKPLYLPDSNRILQHSHCLCYNNCPWLKNTSEKYLFLNPAISYQEAMTLGIQKLGDGIINNNRVGIPFGQQEKLTNRIKRILEGYPCDVEIMKELIQNADDARATEICFILDHREHKTDTLFDSSWEKLQGPALLVYNNKPFKKEDINGIQNLGKGSKGGDHITTGRYGVGFNSVYHLTDTPTFLTTVKGETDQTLVAFDPMCKYVPGSSNDQPGQMFKNITTLREQFPDIFQCYNLPKKLVQVKESTLFRLPLRTKSLAQCSDISEEEVRADDVRNLLKTFEKSSEECLLFLNHVNTIKIAEITDNEECNILHQVRSTILSGHMSRNEFCHAISSSANIYKPKDLLSIPKVKCLYEMKIETDFLNDERQSSEWLIVQQLGVDEAMECDKPNTSFIPKGGVSYKLSSKDINGKIYSLLPLPLESHLPVHINGTFILDHENRRGLWSDENDSFPVLWNNMLLREIIASCYINAMEHVKTSIPKRALNHDMKHSVGVFNLLYPDIPKGNDYMFYLEQNIYKKMVGTVLLPVIEREIPWTFSEQNDNKYVQIAWNPISETREIVSYFESGDQSLRPIPILYNTLKNTGFPIVSAEMHVLQKLKKLDNVHSVMEVSPIAVLQFFQRTDGNINVPISIANTPFLDSAALNVLLDYCKDELYNYLDGLPLLLTKDGMLQKFDKGSCILISEYSKLIPSKQNLFADKLYEKYLEEIGMEFIKVMSCKDLETLLQYKLTENKFKGTNMVVFDESDEEVTSWLSDLWNFICDETYENCENKNKDYRLSMSVFDDWCLLPTSSRCKLYPVKYVTTLIDFKSENTLKEIFQKIQFPRVFQTAVNFERFQNQFVLTRCMTDINNPIETLEALNRASDLFELQFEALTFTECVDLLQYLYNGQRFRRDYTDLHKLMLESLPLYETMNGCFTSLRIPDRECLLVPTTIPSSGISELEDMCRKKFLKPSSEFSELYRFLQIEQLTVCQTYETYILPNFVIFSTNARLEHLKLLRETCLKSYRSIEKDNNTSLLQTLKNIPVLADSDKVLRVVSYFFDNTYELFHKLEKEFPQYPYNEPSWIKFLIMIGLTHKITPELSLKYAQRLEQSLSRGNVVECHGLSELLCNEIYRNWELLKCVCNQLKVIQFLPSAAIMPELLQISNTCFRANGMCFLNSVVWHKQILVWTKLPVLAESLTPPNTEIQTMLGIVEDPQPKIVTEHLQTVLKTQIRFKNQPDFEKCVQFIKETFEYFEKKDLHQYPNLMADIAEIPCIPIEETTILVKACQVTCNLPQKHMNKLVPYLGKLHYCIGNYKTFICHIGTTESATPQQYAYVLNHIFNETKNKTLHPNELDATCHAIEALFKSPKLQNLKLDELHLLTEQKTLDVSKHVVFIDDDSLADRILQKPFPILANLQHFDITKKELQSVIVTMDLQLRPMLLSSLITEELDEQCLRSANETNRCQELKYRLVSTEFHTALLRLLYDSISKSKLAPKELGQYKQYLSKLSNIDVFEVRQVQTHLVYKRTVIPKSEKTLPYFVDKRDRHFRIYIRSDCTRVEDTFTRRTYQVLNDIFEESLQSLAYYITTILSLPIESIETELDKEKIKKYCEENPLSEEKFHDVRPKPGEYIPIELHIILQQCPVLLRKDEYVGFEEHDPLEEQIDSNTDENFAPEMPTFKYAKVVKVMENDRGFLHYRYVINLGNKVLKNVHCSELYRFERTNSESPSCNALQLYVSQERAHSEDNDKSEQLNKKRQKPDVPNNAKTKSLLDIKKEIRLILEEAWKMEESAKKKMIKRLCREWHPDKNYGKEKLATEAFQFIQSEIERLEKGLPPTDLDYSSTKASNSKKSTAQQATNQNYSHGSGTRHSGPSYSNFNFYEYFRQQEESYRNFNRSDESDESSRGFHTHSNSNHKKEEYSSYREHKSNTSKTRKRNPQPGEAKRWIIQAEYDYIAVQKDRNINNEWACFKCYQAAEKALKATEFAFDSTLYCPSEHSLTYLCSAVDEQCQSWATELENLLGDPVHMMYPGYHTSGQIPHNKYTSDHTVLAETLASNIVTKCKAIILSKI